MIKMSEVKLFKDNTYNFNYCQENEQYNNRKGILRGLHYQIEPYAQAKLVQVVKGEVLSVAVDIRKNSNTYGSYVSYKLDDIKQKRMYIPKGFAHGYITLSNQSIFIYQVDEYFNLDSMKGIAFDNKDLNIDWETSENEIIVSDKDLKNKQFKHVIPYRESYE